MSTTLDIWIPVEYSRAHPLNCDDPACEAPLGTRTRYTLRSSAERVYCSPCCLMFCHLNLDQVMADA